MSDNPLSCRQGCAACCIAPSISSPIPGMPHGKPAGVSCVQLDEQGLCRIFNDARRPAVCASLRPSVSMCGTNPDVRATRAHALAYLTRLEQLTAVAVADGE